MRPGDSLTIPRMAWSVGFIRFVSSTDATQATKVLTIPPVGLSPTEHICLIWTHCGAKTRSIALRGRAVVELEQPTEALTTPDRAGSDGDCRGRDEFVAQPLVWAFFMIMMQEFSYGDPEVMFAQ